MADLYDDAIAALAADYIPLGFTRRDPYRNVHEAARAVLDAVAPLIAAKALRDAAADYWQRTDVRSTFEGWSWLKDRADEIEETAK